MLVLCVGMYRACSTWQYGVASEILERHRSVRRLGFIDGGPFAISVEPTIEPDTWNILKAHDADEHYARALESGRALAIYSHRDLRDVLFSWMHKTGSEFHEVVDRGFPDLCLANDRFWRAQPRMLTQTYESLIADPVRGVLEIARHLGIEIDRAEAEAIAEAHSPEANRRRTAELAGRMLAEGIPLDSKDQDHYDPQSLLHWNHLREGRVGGWRGRATPEQMATMARIFGPWLLDNGYEPDDPWTRAILVGLAGHEQDQDQDQDGLGGRLDGWQRERDAWQAERDAWQRERDACQAERDMIQRERDMVQRERDDRQRERDAWGRTRLEIEQSALERALAADRKLAELAAEVEQLRGSLAHQQALAAEVEQLRDLTGRQQALAASDIQDSKAEQERFEAERQRWRIERDDLENALRSARQPGPASRLFRHLRRGAEAQV